MLTLTENVLDCIKKSIEYSAVEQGFALGCTFSLDTVDACNQIPAAQTGMYFYAPDTKAATEVIDRWLEDDICFCGFIHSHRTNKKDFSESDIQFAEKLMRSFRMPYLWFGLLVITELKKEMLFYKLCSVDNKIKLKPVRVCVKGKNYVADHIVNYWYCIN